MVSPPSGDHHHNFSPASRQQRVGAEIQRVIQRRGRSRMDAIDRLVYGVQVGGEGCQLIDDLAELKQRKTVDGSQNRMRKAAR